VGGPVGPCNQGWALAQNRIVMNIRDKKNSKILRAILFCLNADPTLKLLGVDYKSNREVYKCRVLDYNFGGRITVNLDERFVNSAFNWLKFDGKWWEKLTETEKE
jgi:hypothetical protein